MYCHRCGNKLFVDSVFCNRCGSKVRTVEERLNRPRVPVPPGRPARRLSSIEKQPDSYYLNQYGEDDVAEEEDQEGYDEEENVEFNEQGERVIFRINQAFYPVGAAYFQSSLLTVIATALIAYFHIRFWFVPLWAIIFFIPSLFRHFRHIHTVYILTDTKVEIESGWLAKSSRNIPLRHIQDVFVSENFKERMIGIGDIIIDTAASESKISIDNINEPRKYADMILDQLQGWD